jgi:hypothetical protein
MSTISLEDARYFLSQCTGVLLEGRFIEPTVFDIEEDYANEWLVLQWDDAEGEEYGTVSLGFLEGDNQTVLLEGSVMTLIAEDGEEEELTLLREWKPNQT